MNQVTIVLLLATFVGTCVCQYNQYASTTDWWTEYKSKSQNAYNAVNSLPVDRWDTIRQQKKAAALAHLNSLQQIDDSCDLNNMQAVNQGPAIACTLDQEQRHCEFGWAYNPLGTKKQTCLLQNTPHRGNCCTITFPGAGAAPIGG